MINYCLVDAPMALLFRGRISIEFCCKGSNFLLNIQKKQPERIAFFCILAIGYWL